MSRFYDKIIHEKRFRLDDGADIRKATVVDASQATEYYYAINDKEYWHLSDFPNIAPPFPNFFIETKRPSMVNSAKWGSHDWFEPCSAPMLQAEGLDDEEIASYIKRCKDAGNRDLRRPNAWGMHVRAVPIASLKWHLKVNGYDIPDLEYLDVKFACRCVLYVDWAEETGQFTGPVWDVSYGLKADGSVLTVPSLLSRAQEEDGIPALGIDSPSVEYAKALGPKLRPALSRLRPEMVNHINPLLLAISFMHCKNVELRNEAPPRKLMKRAAERGHPLCSYKVLDIIPLKQTLHREGISEAPGIKKALHLCRGHFKTYTEEKPLLGRAVGTFFWPQHLRGGKEHGVIVKDYSIGPKK